MSSVPVTAVKPVTVAETQRWCRLQHVVGAGYRGCEASYSRWNTSLVPVTAGKSITVVATCWCRLQHVVGAGYRCVASYCRWNTSLVPVTAVGEPATCRWGRLPLWSQKHVVEVVYRYEASNTSLGPFTVVKPATPVSLGPFIAVGEPRTCRWGRLPL